MTVCRYAFGYIYSAFVSSSAIGWMGAYWYIHLCAALLYKRVGVCVCFKQFCYILLTYADLNI